MKVAYEMDIPRKLDIQRIHLNNLNKYQFYLGDGVFAIVSDFKNATGITIRRYKQTFDGFWVPTKKRITITAPIWSRIADNMHLIADEIYIQPGKLFIQPKIIENEEYHILQRMIRRDDTHFYNFCPSGCVLSMNQWNTLKSEYSRISAAVMSLSLHI